jgi:hypothetical protein
MASSWSGRLGLVIAAPQQFHAGFELTGDAQHGELRLSTRWAASWLN